MINIILIIDCIYLGACKNFTFQLENDRRAVETSLLFNVNFFSEIVTITFENIC